MTEEQIKYMAERFLGWRIPEPFHPDAGISFDPVFNKGTAHEMRHQPTGTNLWGYTEAVEMVRHMIEGLAADPELSDRLAVQDGLLRRAHSLIRPYCAADEELRAFSDELTVCLVEGKG